jgi:hypothetical protein
MNSVGKPHNNEKQNLDSSPYVVIISRRAGHVGRVASMEEMRNARARAHGITLYTTWNAILTRLFTQGAAEITPTFRKITVGSPKQVVGCGPFR